MKDFVHNNETIIEKARRHNNKISIHVLLACGWLLYNSKDIHFVEGEKETMICKYLLQYINSQNLSVSNKLALNNI